ncbi:MAG: nuclear transport factor 2 family protein [Alphaproteobacteria bacterium]|nr:nuclear transport factor 2 family protein [Alphaproteobacteria bacterium]
MTDNQTRQPDRNDLVHALYSTVDRRDAPGLARFLTDTIVFRLGNHDPIVGLNAVLDANEAFFRTIENMSHDIAGIWTVDETTICNGNVHYVRLDGSRLTLPFATILTFQDERIADYRVYVDVSPL